MFHFSLAENMADVVMNFSTEWTIECGCFDCTYTHRLAATTEIVCRRCFFCFVLLIFIYSVFNSMTATSFWIIHEFTVTWCHFEYFWISEQRLVVGSQNGFFFPVATWMKRCDKKPKPNGQCDINQKRCYFTKRDDVCVCQSFSLPLSMW